MLRRRGFFTDLVYWFVTPLLTRTVSPIGLALILIVVYRDDIAGSRAMLLERDTLLARSRLAFRRAAAALGWLVASPKFHGWHHTSEDEGLDKNFAGLLPLFDVVFGTYYMPKGRLPERFGLARESIPATIRGQMAYPFRRTKLTQRASP
ncbi:MAG TPA: hypothetical protein VFL84_05685 [Gammaproteobacteria bacterium]|nr:hypothetical protein [Gammaproteobacteria bacterium]